MSVKQITARALLCTCEIKACGYIWKTLLTVPPQICPSCRSRAWNGAKKPGRPRSVPTKEKLK